MNTSILSLILVHGLVVGGIALLFRALPWPKSWIAPPEPEDPKALLQVAWAWFWRKFWGCKACAAGRPAALLAWWEPAAIGLDAWCLFFGALALGAFIYAHAGPLDVGGD